MLCVEVSSYFQGLQGKHLHSYSNRGFRDPALKQTLPLAPPKKINKNQPNNPRTTQPNHDNQNEKGAAHEQFKKDACAWKWG